MSIFATVKIKYVINPVTLLYEIKEDRKPLKYIWFALLALASVGFALLCFWLYTSVLHWELPRTAWLERRHAVWESRMQVMRARLDVYDEALTEIEDRDDDVYRSIYGLKTIPDAVKYSGIEGPDRYEGIFRKNANPELQSMVHNVDVMMKRTYLQSKSLDEISGLAKTAGDMASCVPSIPPLAPIGGRYSLSSGFGYRTDPVYGGGELHTGQDFSHPMGTPVYATGDGKVEEASFQFGGYGNQIVIDHGYGYKTRYAHLSTIAVNVGMKVSRGEKIGALGNSGKSTGPHLHYEVMYMGNKVNPLNYMDLTIPESEYGAMVKARADESPNGKRISTSEILKRTIHDHE